MLLTVKSSSATHSTDPLNLSPNMADEDPRDDGSDDDDTGKGRLKGKIRRELPAEVVDTLMAWLLSPEHFAHPYPTPQDQVMLMQETGIDKKQLKNWFTNARRRIWKPMLEQQIEHGNLNATAAAGATGPGVPGMMIQAMPSGMDDNSQFQQQQ